MNARIILTVEGVPIAEWLQANRERLTGRIGSLTFIDEQPVPIGYVSEPLATAPIIARFQVHLPVGLNSPRMLGIVALEDGQAILGDAFTDADAVTVEMRHTNRQR